MHRGIKKNNNGHPQDRNRIHMLPDGLANRYPHGIIFLDSHSTCLYANPSVIEATKYTFNELDSRSIHELLCQSRSADTFTPKSECPLCSSLAHTDTAKEVRTRFYRKDGTRLDVWCKLSLVRRNAEPIGWLLELSSEQDSNSLNCNLADLKISYQRAIEHAKISLWVIDLRSGLISIYPVLPDAIWDGTDSSMDVTKKKWQDIVKPEDHSILNNALQNSTEHGGFFAIELRARLSDEQATWIAMRGAAAKCSSAASSYASGILFEIAPKEQAAQINSAKDESFRWLADAIAEGVFIIVGDKIDYVNHAALRILGTDCASKLIGRSASEVLETDKLDLHNLLQSTDSRAPFRWAVQDLLFKHSDGSCVKYEARCIDVNWNGQSAKQVVFNGPANDRRNLLHIRRLSERLQLAIEGTGECIWDWDIPNNKFTISGGLNKILGYSEHEATGDYSDWENAVHPNDKEYIISAFRNAVEGKTPVYECEYRLQTKDGGWRWVRARGVIVERDLDGKPLVMTGTLVDITEKKESDEVAWRHANLDSLTGLPNRRLFRERLEYELRKAKRNSQSLALLFIDLDGFKQVNDIHGHETGDMLLVEAAERLQNCVRDSDSVARLGGDEFTVVLTGLNDLGHIEIVCQKILTQLSEPFKLQTNTVYVSCSIGISLYPLDAMHYKDMMRKADLAMYSAKNSGKCQFHYFTKEMDEKAHFHLRIIDDLRHAISNKQINIHYQPVVNSKDGQIVKVEALLRWKHPVYGEIGPNEFIPLAEESGLIGTIEKWVLSTVCEQNVAWQKAGLPKLSVAVNLSVRRFAGEALLDHIAFSLQRTCMAPECLELEISEEIFSQKTDLAKKTLQEIKNLGVKLAIDNFGTGLCSFTQLQSFPIDILKLDRSFIQNILTSHRHQCLAKAIIAMGKSLQLTVTAEGVETEEQLAFINENACDEAQGYYFAEPITPEELEARLRRRYH